MKLKTYVFYILYFHKWKLMGKILNFTSDFTWDVSLASDFISENSSKMFWISQVISRGMCHRRVTGNTTNEYKEQVKSRGTSKNFNLNFLFWKSGHPIQLSLWSVTCSSLVQEDMSHGTHKVIHKGIHKVIHK